MYKLSIDAMSGDLGSSIVVEACEKSCKAIRMLNFMSQEKLKN